jgi:integrase/recombinase XerC
VNDIERFVNFLRVEKRFSKHTVTAYSTDIEQFSIYLNAQYQITDLSECTHFIIRSWIVSLIEAGIDPRSVNRKVTTLRTFYRFLLKEGKVLRSPMLKVQAPKVAKKLPEYIDEPKMERLLSENQSLETFEELRNYLMVDFFYRTGVRLSELIGIKVADVNLYNLTITVLGKRNKIRQIPFTLNFKESIKKYLNARESFLQEKEKIHEFFFVDNSGNQMYPKFVYRIVKTAISSVSTGKKRSPHILRHSFATSMLNHGADINSIKEILGHSSLAATQVYTHNSIEKLKEVYKQAFPKA